MKTRECLAICLVIVAGNTALAAEPTPEERWARGIAEDFWQALFNDNFEQTAGLLSPELATTVVGYEEYRDWRKPLNVPMSLRSRAWGYGPATTVSFDSQELAPDRSEVVFRGSLGGKDINDKKVKGRFTMRIAKDGSASKWSIRFITFTDHDLAVGKGN
ncbi:MAG TPA: hypothetical protein VKD71_04640 [Gemmataceae bacterium]|nr:hypothetical protein [Gemmataceae bacterium]